MRQVILVKAKTKPFQKSVVRFREIMIKTCSPLDKLFMLKELKEQIQQEVQEFWSGIITDPSKLVLTRDELTSIMIFIICKSEVPDLFSQLRLTNEFTSPDIQQSSRAFPISDTYMLLYTTIDWFSCLDPAKIE